MAHLKVYKNAHIDAQDGIEIPVTEALLFDRLNTSSGGYTWQMKPVYFRCDRGFYVPQLVIVGTNNAYVTTIANGLLNSESAYTSVTGVTNQPYHVPYYTNGGWGTVGERNGSISSISCWNKAAMLVTTATSSESGTYANSGNYNLSFAEESIPYVSNLLVPQMTSNTTPSGVASATYNNIDAWKAFCGLYWHGGSSATPQYLTYTFPYSTIINSYCLTSGNANSDAYSVPNAWTLQGSLNGVDWVDLNSQSNISTWAQNRPKKFTFSNNTAYMSYRFKFTTIGYSSAIIVELGLD